MSNTRLNVDVVADSVSTNNFNLIASDIESIPYNTSMLIKDNSRSLWGIQTVVVRTDLPFQEVNCDVPFIGEFKLTFRYYIQAVYVDLYISGITFIPGMAYIDVEISPLLNYRPKFPNSLNGSIAVKRSDNSTFSGIVSFLNADTLRIEFGDPPPLADVEGIVYGQFFYERDFAM